MIAVFCVGDNLSYFTSLVFTWYKKQKPLLIECMLANEILQMDYQSLLYTKPNHLNSPFISSLVSSFLRCENKMQLHSRIQDNASIQVEDLFAVLLRLFNTSLLPEWIPRMMQVIAVIAIIKNRFRIIQKILVKRYCSQEPS